MKDSSQSRENILLAVDDPPVTPRAVAYVARTAAERELCIHLLHVAVYPPALQESRGAENPQEEERVEKQLERKQREWRAEVEQAAGAIFEKARAELTAAGRDGSVECHTLTLPHRDDLEDAVLQTAREFSCRTIVVGRNCFPLLKELLVDHLGEKIARKAADLSVKIVD